MIEFVPVTKRENLGSYTLHNDEDVEYDPRRLKSIKLYYQSDFSENFISRYTGQKTFTYKDMYSIFYFAFHSTLEHELQHAYDDYRSKSKIYYTRAYEKYRQKYYTQAGEEVATDDSKKTGQKYKDYLRLQHEIWARFTETIKETMFSYGDFAETPEGVPYFVYKMHSLPTAIKNFQSNFHGWRAMTDNIKKRLLNRVVQYWYKEKEELPEKNKKQIDSAMAHHKDKSLAEIKKNIHTILNNK